MVRFFTIDIGFLSQEKLQIYSFNNDVEIIELNGKVLNEKIPDLSKPTRINAFSTILTLEGEANIEIDDLSYRLFPNTFIDITRFHIFRKFTFSDNYKGYNLLISNHFYNEIFTAERHLTPRMAIFKNQNPLEVMSLEQTALLVAALNRIIQNIKRETHLWRKQMIMNEIRSFFMEAGNIILHNSSTDIAKQTDKELLILKFIQLLEEHNTERKTVKFYADKLCMHTDHFTKIIKAQTGRNVIDWINESLLRKAKLYLRNPEMSIQQVAYMLNFSDQSAFGKFFKKQTQMSPNEYKKQNR